MNFKVYIFLFLFAFAAKGVMAQCETVHDYPETQPSFKSNHHEMFEFFRENILDIIYDTESGEFPPTSFKMILVINDQDEVESISEIRGDYSQEVQAEILEVLQNEKGWKSGEDNGEKVCSKYYFVVGCILWH